MGFFWGRAVSFGLMAMTITGCVSTGQMASQERLKSVHNVAVVALLGDNIEFQSQSLLAGFVGIGATVEEKKVDLGLTKVVADDVAHLLSRHVNVVAVDTPENAHPNTPGPSAPTLEGLRALGIEPSEQVDTYVIVSPTTFKVVGPGLLLPNTFAFTGLVVIGGSGNPSLLATYTASLMDARTGEIFANGNPQMHKRAMGKSLPMVGCDGTLLSDTPAATTDAQRQTLTQEFTILLKASLPWALANAGMLSEAQANEDEAAAGEFTACHRMLASVTNGPSAIR
ncbi:MAG TPA: hypothetical protein VGF92_03635 [Stellaceae bacterium]|jgi:hypothetical protein